MSLVAAALRNSWVFMSDPQPELARPEQSARTRTGWKRILRSIRFAVVVYLLVLLLMMLLENHLIFPAPKYPAGDWNPVGLDHQEVEFTSADGTKLHGWYLAHANPKAQVLFCHGNAENVSYLADLLAHYRDSYQVSIFAFDYRGYGRSEGAPQEQGILADGRAAQDWLARQAGVAVDEIVLVGRSLGGAVAVELAATRGARGLILERTFTSLPDVAARHYPFLPIRLMIKTQLDSASKISRYQGPLLLSHGSADVIVPFELGERLFEKASSPSKQFYVEAEAGHNDPYSTEYLDILNRFLSSLNW